MLFKGTKIKIFKKTVLLKGIYDIMLMKDGDFNDL